MISTPFEEIHVTIDEVDRTYRSQVHWTKQQGLDELRHYAAAAAREYDRLVALGNLSDPMIKICHDEAIFKARMAIKYADDDFRSLPCRDDYPEGGEDRWPEEFEPYGADY